MMNRELSSLIIKLGSRNKRPRAWLQTPSLHSQRHQPPRRHQVVVVVVPAVVSLFHVLLLLALIGLISFGTNNHVEAWTTASFSYQSNRGTRSQCQKHPFSLATSLHRARRRTRTTLKVAVSSSSSSSSSATTSKDEQEETRIQPQQQQQSTSSSSTTTLSSTLSSSSSSIQSQHQYSPVAAQFHHDMRRVINSRQHILPEAYPNRFQERKQRPTVLDADLDGAERCLAMLRHLQQIHNAADETSFQITMQAFLQRGRLRWTSTRQRADTAASKDTRRTNAVVVCAADQLEELLHELWLIKPARNVSLQTYNLVLEAYANCATPRGERNYAGRARALWERIQSMFGMVDSDNEKDEDENNNNNEGISQQYQLQVESLMHVLRAYAWQQANLRPDDDCASQAQDLLQPIETLSSKDPRILLQSYDWVLEAWSKSGAVGSAEKANALFEQIKALNATLLTATAASYANNTTAAAAAAAAAGQILDAETYCNCALAWAKTPEANGAEKAHEILLDMIEKYNQGAFPAGSEPSLIAFNGVMSAWARQGRADKAEQVLFLMEKLRPSCRNLVPDAVSYNSVLYAHAKSPDKEVALQKALALVQYMKENSSEQPSIKPNSFTYNTLLKCWIQSGREDLAEQAEQTLIQMERLWEQGDYAIKPNNRIFNMVINAYAKSNDWNAARKAYRILERMKSLKEDCKPDVISYTSVMESLSKSNDHDASQRAEELLQEAFERYHKTKNPRDRPNLRTFTMAILTLAKSHGSVIRARALLTQLLQLYQDTQSPDLLPNEYPYNYVLNCAANTLNDNEKLEAFQIATRTYQEMRQSPFVTPDSFTYAFWLKCCNNLLPPGDLRQRCVTYAFDECKKEGLVSNEVLTRLYQGNSPQLVKELLDHQEQKRTSFLSSRSAYRSLKIQDLPRSWSCEAVRRSRKR